MKEKSIEAAQFMREHEHKTSEVMMLIIQRTIYILLGEAERLSHDVVKSVNDNKNPRQHFML